MQRTDRMIKKLMRRYVKPDGGEIQIPIHPCACFEKERRGEEGGVCGNCGGAIATEEERARLGFIKGFGEVSSSGRKIFLGRKDDGTFFLSMTTPPPLEARLRDITSERIKQALEFEREKIVHIDEKGNRHIELEISEETMMMVARFFSYYNIP